LKQQQYSSTTTTYSFNECDRYPS